MPLNLADFNKKYRISKVCGQEKQRHYLESLGLYVEVKSNSFLKSMAITLSWLREAKSGLRRVWQSESFCTPLKPKEIYKKYDLGAIFASVVVANKIRTGRMGIKLEEIE